MKRKHSILSYIVACLLFLLGIIFFTQSVVGAIMLIIAGMLILPSTADSLLDRFNLSSKASKAIRLVGAFTLFVLAMARIPSTPTNAKVAKAEVKKDDGKAATVQADAEETEPRSKAVEKFFSAWDGSHPGLERAVKESMNDPDSYDHVETRFRDDKETIYVIMKFRGKNAFGGTVQNVASGTIDGNTGELIKWDLNK